MDVHGDPVVFHNPPQGQGQGGIMVIGEGVHEVHDAIAAAAIRTGQLLSSRDPQEALPSETGEFSPLSQAEDPLHHPPRCPIANRPVGHPMEAAAHPAPMVHVRHEIIGGSQPVDRHVGRLGFDHQLGDIDVSGAFQSTLVAVDAEVDDLFEVVCGHDLRVQPSGKDPPQEVGLGPRRGFLARRQPEDGAHPYIRKLRPAGSTAIAGPHRVSHLVGVPIQLQRD